MIESCAATEASAQQRSCQIFFSLDDQACLCARVLFNGRGKLEKNKKKKKNGKRATDLFTRVFLLQSNNR